MPLEVSAVLEGKVTGITKFGAFVALPEGKSGLVHISEVANAFVSDVHEYVQMGQTVRVKVMSVSPEGKINLSIKRALEEAPRQPFQQERGRAPAPRSAPVVAAPQAVNGPSGDTTFEDKLKRFMQESDSRIADNPLYSDRPRKSRRR